MGTPVGERPPGPASSKWQIAVYVMGGPTLVLRAIVSVQVFVGGALPPKVKVTVPLGTIAGFVTVTPAVSVTVLPTVAGLGDGTRSVTVTTLVTVKPNGATAPCE